MAIPTINARFNTLRKRRFLMHLVWQHDLVGINRFQLQSESCSIDSLGIIQALFNQSCDPNVVHIYDGNKQMCTTIKPVKKGQQLFITYYKDLLMKSTHERQKKLRDTFKFTCQCSRCVPKFRNIDSLTMQQDPNFQYIKDSECDLRKVTSEELLIQKEKCFQFMRKYGHFPCSEEIFFVMLAIIDIISHSFD